MLGSMIVSSCYSLLCLHLGFLGHKITQHLKTGSEQEANQLNGYMWYHTSVSCLQSSNFIIRNQRVWGKNLKYVTYVGYVKAMYTYAGGGGGVGVDRRCRS